MDVLTLEIGTEVFAIEATAVREILDLVPVTEVPGARPFVGGVINVRGRIVPLVDMRLRLAMPPAAPTADTRIIVLDIALEGEPTAVGILADRVNEVVQLDLGMLEEAPRLGLRWQPEFIRSVGMRSGRLVVLPDLERILT
ncbi:chemotaxis protein CheW [Paracraurococcus ruber]|uniref:chemotaxis protein CheW n=1 Tax=Paracraurococcus ruber TaxID=77675 RepID=UPI001F021FBA|nr:chemotaxis protein CheW [Paracraurococcus ruber]